MLYTPHDNIVERDLFSLCFFDFDLSDLTSLYRNGGVRESNMRVDELFVEMREMQEGKLRGLAHYEC